MTLLKAGTSTVPCGVTAADEQELSPTEQQLREREAAKVLQVQPVVLTRGSWTSSISLPWEAVKMPTPRPHPPS